MISPAVYNALLRLSFALAGVIFTALFFISAPYGRHVRREWGPAVPNHTGWVIMEAPAALVFAYFFITGSAPKNLTAFVFLGLWEAHYIHRAFIYPFQIADGRKKMPVVVILMGFVFNTGNATLNGAYLFLALGRLSLEVAGRPALHLWVGAVRGRVYAQPVGGPQAAPIAGAGRDGLQDPARGVVRAGVMPQLPGGDHRVERLGAGNLEPGWADVCGVDVCQPGAACPCPPPVVQGKLSGLPAGEEGADTRGVVSV